MSDENVTPVSQAVITAVEAVRAEADALRARQTALHAELSEIGPRLRDLDKAIALLDGSAAVRGRPTAAPVKRPSGTKYPKSVGPALLARIEADVRALAAERDEFRQIDVRARLNIGSSAATVAFERLRQAGVIRFARQDGNNKYFRLTRESVNGGTSNE